MAICYDCPLVFVSTSEIYGPSKGPIAEHHDKILRGSYTVRNEYGQAKLLAEIILKNAALDNPRLYYQIIRPFNVCGRRKKTEERFVLPRFISSTLQNKYISVFGDGSHIRSFVHVKDLVRGMEHIVNHGTSNSEWNIGAPMNTCSIFNLAQQVKKLCNSISDIVFTSGNAVYGSKYAEAYNKQPCIDKIIQYTGWGPQYSLEDIIKETRDYWKCTLLT